MTHPVRCPAPSLCQAGWSAVTRWAVGTGVSLVVASAWAASPAATGQVAPHRPAPVAGRVGSDASAMPVSTAVQVPAPAHLPAAPDDLSAAVPRETGAHATDAPSKRAKVPETRAATATRNRVAKGTQPQLSGGKSTAGRAEKASAKASAKAGRPRTRATASTAAVDGVHPHHPRRTSHAAQAVARHPVARTERSAHASGQGQGHVARAGQAARGPRDAREARAARVAHAKATGPSKAGDKRHAASATQASAKGARGKSVPVGARRHRAQA